MLKKGFMLMFGILSAFIILGGCASNGDDSAAANSVLFGQITAIDGTNITIAAGAPPQRPQMNESQNGADATSSATANGDAPTGPQDGNGPSGDMPQQNGKVPGNPPSGGAFRGDGDVPGGMTLTEEEKTITVSDSTVITIQSGSDSKTGSLADLQTGDIVTAQTDGKEVMSITVMRMAGGFPDQDANPDSQGIDDIIGDTNQV